MTESASEATRAELPHLGHELSQGRARAVVTQHGAQLTLEFDGQPIILPVVDKNGQSRLHSIATDPRPVDPNPFINGETRRPGGFFLSWPFHLEAWYRGPVHGQAGSASTVWRLVKATATKITLALGSPDQPSQLDLSSPRGHKYGAERSYSVEDTDQHFPGAAGYAAAETTITSFAAGHVQVPAFGDHPYFACDPQMALVVGIKGIERLEDLRQLNAPGVRNNDIDTTALPETLLYVPGQLVLLPNGVAGRAIVVRGSVQEPDGSWHAADISAYRSSPGDSYLAVEPAAERISLGQNERATLLSEVAIYESVEALQAALHQAELLATAHA